MIIINKKELNGFECPFEPEITEETADFIGFDESILRRPELLHEIKIVQALYDQEMQEERRAERAT